MAKFPSLAGLALFLALAGAAAAQEPGPVLTDPEAVGRCLCGQRFVETMHERALAAQREFDAAHARQQALQHRVDQSRAAVDPNDPDQVDAFRRLLLESETETARLFNEVLPHTQSVLARYNERRERYTESCGGRQFDALVYERQKAVLSCGVEN
jgi:hypothetical protein